MLVVTLLLVVALAIGLSVALAAPILAVPFVLVGIGAFLAWRGKRRADVTLGDRSGARVPSTEATASDADHHRRADVPSA